MTSDSYYGRPIVKAPPWKHDIAAYLFTGGLAAGSALIAAGGQATGRPALRVAGRLGALAGIGASTFFLINDLGRKERFHHMLRVAKPTSPMSMGTWIFSAFATAAGAAAVGEVAPRPLRFVGTAGGYGAAALAPAVATYTAVLLSDTATPSWHAAYPDLPFLFAGSAAASGAAVGLIAAPTAQAGPARRLAVLGAAAELAACHRVEHAHGLLSEPYRQGKAGRLLTAARYLSAAGAVGAVLGRKSRVVSALAGVSLLAGSLATRLGVFEGGMASTRDPKYVVVPQKERLARRELAQRTSSVTPGTGDTSSPITG